MGGIRKRELTASLARRFRSCRSRNRSALRVYSRQLVRYELAHTRWGT